MNYLSLKPWKYKWVKYQDKRFDIWIGRNQGLRSQQREQVTHGGKVSWVTSGVGDPGRSARLDLAEFKPFKACDVCGLGMEQKP